MNEKVWINNRVPQTLYVAQILLYIRGAFGVLSLGAIGRVELFGSELLATLVILLASFGALGGAFGIANSYKWGWRLGVAAASVPFVIRLQVAVDSGIGEALSYDLIGLVFDIGVLAALLHQQSAEHQRIYFR